MFVKRRESFDEHKNRNSSVSERLKTKRKNHNFIEVYTLNKNTTEAVCCKLKCFSSKKKLTSFYQVVQNELETCIVISNSKKYKKLN